MKTAINILKGLEIILTAIWGIIFGVLTPLSVMFAGIVDDSIANHYIVKVWLINSVLCYIVGTVIVMLGLYRVALGFHTVGLVTSLVIYGVFRDMYGGIEAQNPAQLYMPIIFVTFITLAITIIANYKKITAKLSQSNDKKYEAAPSILGGEYKTDKPVSKNSGKKKKGSKK